MTGAFRAGAPRLLRLQNHAAPAHRPSLPARLQIPPEMRVEGVPRGGAATFSMQTVGKCSASVA